MRLGYCRIEPCLLFHPPLIIQITLQCNRYGVAGCANPAQGKGGAEREFRVGQNWSRTRYQGEDFLCC